MPKMVVFKYLSCPAKSMNVITWKEKMFILYARFLRMSSVADWEKEVIGKVCKPSLEAFGSFKTHTFEDF